MELCIYYFFPWKGLPYSFCLWKITFLKNLCKHLLPVFYSPYFWDRLKSKWSKCGPWAWCQFFIFQISPHPNRLPSWSADELKKEPRTIMRTPQCHLTCNPSHSCLHLIDAGVYLVCLKGLTPITANTTNKGAHHGLLWCPAPLASSGQGNLSKKRKPEQASVP